MKTVLIAGATGYLGRFLCAEYARRGWYVQALVRDAGRARDLQADTLVQAQATDATSLRGIMQGADLVISALGLTRQADGLRYRDVDYQANRNLLDEALRAGVGRFAYVHVLGAERMGPGALIDAKRAFVADLTASEIASTVIAPSGYFSDMRDFLRMARRGRVWLFGRGTARINPIHGADLAQAIAQSIEAGRAHVEIGGPEVLTHREIAQHTFEALDQPVRITHLPDWIRRALLWVLPRISREQSYGAAQFFLSAMGQDMVGAPHGTRRLSLYFKTLETLGEEK